MQQCRSSVVPLHHRPTCSSLRRPHASPTTRPARLPPAARLAGRAPSMTSADLARRAFRRPHLSGRAPHRPARLASPSRAPPAARIAGRTPPPTARLTAPRASSAGRSPRRSTRRARRPDRSRAQLHRWATDPATGKPDPGAERPDPAAHAAVVASWSPSSLLSMASAPAICFEGEEGKEGMGCSPPPPSRGLAGLPASPSGGGEVGRRGRRLPGEGVVARVALRGG